MKALRCHYTGEPGEVLTVEDIPEPTPAPGQILVRVLAAPLSFPDLLLCRGQYQFSPPLPMTPGLELCGTVESAGNGGARFTVGDRVIGNPAPPNGAFAELALLEEAAAHPAPQALGDAEASALGIGYQTGWFALHRRARLRAGETLLVHAAAGGVGSAAVQLGKAAGATVIGVVGGARKAQYCEDLGADLVIDRNRDDFIAAVKDFTGGRGADVIFDPVGGDAYAGSTKCVAFEGRILVIGFAGGTVPTPGLNHALIKNYSIMGLHWGLYLRHDPGAVAECHRHLTSLAEAGTIAPLVTERLPLADTADGLGRLGDGLRVALLDLDADACTVGAQRISEAGGRAQAFGADVGDAEVAAEAVARVAAALGPPTVLVNNAGITRDNLLYKMSEDDWDSVIGVHLRGAFLMSRAVQEYMTQRRSGRIVNLSSKSALGNRGQANYSAAKAGLQGFTKTLAIELGGFGITVNAIAPGFIATDMTAATARRLGMSTGELHRAAAEQIPMGRVGVPEDIAHTASFLISEDASFVSGQVIYVAGGPVD
ncbi:MAG: SDR family oxidoreductase [Stackebrandtia sp.]